MQTDTTVKKFLSHLECQEIPEAKDAKTDFSVTRNIKKQLFEKKSKLFSESLSAKKTHNETLFFSHILYIEQKKTDH